MAITNTPTPILWKDYQEELAPRWLRAGDGRAWLRAYGDMKDAWEARVRDGIKARFPTYAPLDALPVLSAERQLDQGPTESTADFRERLRIAWELWPWAGTARGVLLALHYIGYDNAWVITGNGRVHGLNPDLSLYTYAPPDGPAPLASGFWNGFRVLFAQPLKASWVPTLPTNTSDEVNTIRRVIKTWKAGHAIFEDMVVQESGLLWGFPETQDWGDVGLTWGGTVTVWTAD